MSAVQESFYVVMACLTARVDGLLTLHTTHSSSAPTSALLCSRGGAGAISSIGDMQRFIDQYPALKSQGLAVGKHVGLLSEMVATINARREC